MLSLINEIQKRDGTRKRGRERERKRKAIRFVERVRRDKEKSAEQGESGPGVGYRREGWAVVNINVHIQRL